MVVWIDGQKKGMDESMDDRMENKLNGNMGMKGMDETFFSIFHSLCKTLN